MTATQEVKMSDELDLLIGSIEGEGPSPDFVASLREQIVAETTALADLADGGEPVSLIDLRPEPEEQAMSKTRWIIGGLVAAAIVLIVGVAVLASGGDEEEGGGLRRHDRDSRGVNEHIRRTDHLGGAR
jgi:hypothetical protein